MMRQPQATDTVLTPEDKRQVVRRTYRMLRPRRGLLALATLFVILQAAGVLAGPAIVRYGIDHGVATGDVGALNSAAIAFIVAVTFV